MLEHMNQGLDRAPACLTVRSAADELWDLLADGGTALSQAHLGFARLQSASTDADSPSATLTHAFACLLHELPERLESLRAQVRGTVAGFSMINVCDRLDVVRARAGAAGITSDIQVELASITGETA